MTNRNRLPVLLSVLAIGVLASAGVAYASGIWLDTAAEYPSPYGTTLQVQTGGAPMGTMVFAYWIDTASGQEVLVDANTIDPYSGTAWVTLLPHVSAYRLEIGFTPGMPMATSAGYVGGLEHD